MLLSRQHQEAIACGMLAVWFFGCAISYYLNPRSKFLLIGLLPACWTFVGDYTAYDTRDLHEATNSPESTRCSCVAGFYSRYPLGCGTRCAA
jgi:hypothetical protein